MRLVLAVLLLFAALPCRAQEHRELDLYGLDELLEPQPFVTGWDWAAMATMEALITLDVMQSLDIKNHRSTDGTGVCLMSSSCPGGEANPVIRGLFGRYPSDAQFRLVWAVSSLATNGIYLALPHKYRPLWFAGIASIEAAVVIRNGFMVGLRMRL